MDSLSNTNSNSFKGTSGRRYLKGLFFETTLADKSSVLYTLKEKDHEGYPSLYRLYMECKDPTEYRFATTYLDGWSHWEELCQCTWFQPHLEQWRRELEIRMKSECLLRIMDEADNPLSKDRLRANTYLLEKGWAKPTKNMRGRPSKQEIKEAATEMAREQEQISSDFERLRLN